jgi:hypothetical protein
MTMRSVAGPAHTAEALVEVAELLPEQMRGPLLSRTHEVASEVRRGRDGPSAETSKRRAVELEPAEHALAAARAMDGYERRRVIAAIAPRLPEARHGEALRLIRAIEDREQRGAALLALAPYLNWRCAQRALAVAREVKPKSVRIKAIIALAGRLDGASRRTVGCARHDPHPEASW